MASFVWQCDLMPRSDAQPASELIDSAFWFETNDAPLLHHDLNLSDLAHLLHLNELALVPRNAARTLIQLLLQLDQDTNFTYDPAQGDAFTNREHWIEARAPDAVGYLSTGRARREATTVAFRLAVRRALLELSRTLIQMQNALLDLAACHVETLMPDYTYLQAAHPTTLAHYLLSFVYPLRRGAWRVREAFALINQSPGGIGSINGSRLPLRRERLAELLGFDSVITHARDAVWQVDAPLGAINAAATIMLHLDRLAEDLQIFNSAEFGFIELSDEFARASVIMPQKKNPYPLAFVRGAAGSLFSRVVEMYAIAQTPSAQIDNRILAHGAVPRALDLSTRCVKLMAGLCSNLKINSERMTRGVEESFTQATDLAEVLMQTHQLDYRTAYQIVGRAASKLRANNQTARAITPALIAESAREILGKPLGLSENSLAAALEPAAIIETRTGIGGAAPARVREMIADCRADVDAQRAWLDETQNRIARAESSLVESARGFSKT
jgi:argininosuccinate lyase